MGGFDPIPEAPFTLALKAAEALTCEQVVRALPGRRLVCRGQWAGQRVYAKLFMGRNAGRYAARDAQGVALATAAGIATPALLHAGQAADGACEVLVYAEVVGANDVESLWQAWGGEAHRAMAIKLVCEVARHHRAGIMQADLYLKNFLLQGETLYTLDGDGIRRLPRLFGSRAAWGNLALLLSKFDPVALLAWLPDLLQAYIDERGGRAISLERLAALTEAQRHRVVDGYAGKKVFRNCSDVTVTGRWHYFAARIKGFDAAIDQLAPDALDALIDCESESRLKSGHTCTVALVTIGGRQVVVKRYNIKHWLHGLGRIFRRTRASVSWANAHRLRMHEIATAAPLALIERRFGPCRLQAYFIADYIAAPDMAHWMADRAVAMADKQAVAARLASLMYKLRLLQIAHGDMKATNIHVHGVAPVLIDLDSMRHVRCRWWFERQHVRDLKRLLRNWADRPHIQRMVVQALQETYGADPLLLRAGVAMAMNSENR